MLETIQPDRPLDHPVFAQCVLESITDAVAVLNPQWQYVYVNVEAERLLQHPASELLGRTIWEMFPEAIGTEFEREYRRAVDEGVTIEVRDYYPPFDTWFAVHGYPSQAGLMLLFQDVTAHMRVEIERERLYRALDIERACLRDIINQAPSFVCVLRGPEHVFELANPPYMKIVGHRDIMGKTIREALPEVEGQGFFELLDEVYRSGKPYVGQSERILVQQEADGTLAERIVDFVYQPLHAIDGSISGIIAYGVDLTDRIRAEEEKARALSEVEALNRHLQRAMTETHHRVKNNLQLISAMIDMQVLEAPDTLPIAEYRRLGAHVRVLAEVHDILTQQTKAGDEANLVPCKPMLERLLAVIQQTSLKRAITYDIADLHLEIRQATSLALVMNELVSNALKYGRDRIHARLAGSEETALVQVDDDGPGFPAGFCAVEAANTGLDLVENLSRLDLRGQTCYSRSPYGGGRVEICFPLRQVVRQAA